MSRRPGFVAVEVFGKSYRRFGPRDIMRHVGKQLVRVTDDFEINTVESQFAFDEYQALADAGKWPEGKPRPVKPHRSGRSL